MDHPLVRHKIDYIRRKEVGEGKEDECQDGNKVGKKLLHEL